MIPLALALDFTDSQPVLNELMRRAVDGTVIPIFVDYTNKRVIIGSTSASAVPQMLEVAGNIKITTGGNYLVLPDSGGAFWKCYPDTAGRWRVDSIAG